MWRSPISARVAFLGFFVPLFLGSAQSATAQFSADPYRPWNSQYDSYIYPSYPSAYGIYPNQAALELPVGGRATRPFQRFVEDLEGTGSDGTASTPRREIGIPYTSAYRRYDSTYGRIYKPNELSDESYNRNRQARDEKLLELRQAQTPEERTRLRKEYDLYNRQALRDLMSGGPKSRSSTRSRSSSEPELELPGLSPSPSTGRGTLPRITVPRSSSPTGSSGRSSLPSLGGSSSRTNSTRSSTSPKRRSPTDPLRRGPVLDRPRLDPTERDPGSETTAPR